MNNDAIVIGIAGVARAGKDTFASLIKKSKKFEGKKIRQLAFADDLKATAGEFLKEYCNVPDVTKLTGDAKTDVRPFLVWYGCYMRKQNPLHWVQPVAQKILQDSDTDVFVVTDIRFKNEADWIHDIGGKLIHVKRFQPEPLQASVVPPANEEEAKNDPEVDRAADVHVRWPTARDSNIDSLQRYVDEALSRL